MAGYPARVKSTAPLNVSAGDVGEVRQEQADLIGDKPDGFCLIRDNPAEPTLIRDKPAEPTLIRDEPAGPTCAACGSVDPQLTFACGHRYHVDCVQKRHIHCAKCVSVPARPLPAQSEQSQRQDAIKRALAASSAHGSGGDKVYEVSHTRVAVRKMPHTSADVISVLQRGRRVVGEWHDVRGEPWLRLGLDSCAALGLDVQCAWMLVHGRNIGLGELMRERPDIDPKRPLKPEPPPKPPVDIGALRAECEKWGLPDVGWCSDEQPLKEMLDYAKLWGPKSSLDIQRECNNKGIHVDQDLPKTQFLGRLMTVRAWEAMPKAVLLRQCKERGINPKLCNEESNEKELVQALKRFVFGLAFPAFRGGQGGRRASEPKKKSASEKPTDNNDNEIGPRCAKLLEEFTSFSADLPGAEAELYWTDDELRQYFFSNGYIAPPPNKYAPTKPKSGSQFDTHYRVLGLEPGAQRESIRKAYRQLALRHHPDKTQSSPDAVASERIFKAATEAYEALQQAGVA